MFPDTELHLLISVLSHCHVHDPKAPWTLKCTANIITKLFKYV